MTKTLIILLLFISINLISAPRYILKCRPILVELSRIVAIEQIGVVEVGNNDGKQIVKYLKSVNLPKGNPYCAAGQYWCFSEAALKLCMSSKEIPILKTGSTYYMFNDARNKGKLSKNSCQVSDLVFWKMKNTIRGHVERIIEVKAKGWLYTVGFNTSSGLSGSQRDGDGVFKRKRNIMHPLGRMVLRGFVGFNE